MAKGKHTMNDEQRFMPGARCGGCKSPLRMDVTLDGVNVRCEQCGEPRCPVCGSSYVYEVFKKRWGSNLCLYSCEAYCAYGCVYQVCPVVPLWSPGEIMRISFVREMECHVRDHPDSDCVGKSALVCGELSMAWNQGLESELCWLVQHLAEAGGARMSPVKSGWRLRSSCRAVSVAYDGGLEFESLAAHGEWVVEEHGSDLEADDAIQSVGDWLSQKTARTPRTLEPPFRTFGRSLTPRSITQEDPKSTWWYRSLIW